jgi:hypothetical protein
MHMKIRTRSAVTRYFAASLLFLIIGVRFYTMGDQIGTVVYTVTTSVSLMMALGQLAKKV